jgi:adenine deaminase
MQRAESPGGARSRRLELIDVALGRKPATLVVRGGKLVNVLTREIYPADVAILGDRFAAVGQVDHTVGPATASIDARGKYLTPGFIDQHIHIHETQLNIVEFAAAVMPRGTTGVVTDLYGEMVVSGVKAVRTCLDAAKGLPLKVWFMLGTPGYYQNTPFGTTGQPSLAEMLELLDWPECHGMDDAFASKIAAADPDMLRLVDAVQGRGKRVCGHGSEITGRPLAAWIAYVRATDDHECVDPAEAVEKARLGVRISMREGSGCYNVSAVAKAVTEYGVDPRRFCFSTDLISPLQIADDGHIDNAVRKSVCAGVPPLIALQMATLNAAECLKVDEDYGSITPGKVADLLLLEDLAEVRVAGVIASGEFVAQDGQMLRPMPTIRFPEWARGTVRFPRPLQPSDFSLRVGSKNDEVTVRVIAASGESLLTRELHERMSTRNGEVTADTARDVLKIAAIERVRGTGECGVGLIRGFGLKSGAIATTYNSQEQNLIVLGTNDQDMALAANTLARVGGGFVIADGGRVKGLLELPLFGLESDQPYAHVVARLRELNHSLRELGCLLPAAFHTLGFMGLPVDIGTLKICPKGLIDVWKREVVSLEVG